MVAQSSANFSIFRGLSSQRGRGFGVLAQTLGRTAIPLNKKYIVPAAERIGANLFEIAAPGIGEVVIGRKKLKTFAKDVGMKTVRKQLGGGKNKSKCRTRRAFLEKVVRRSVALAKTFIFCKNKISLNQNSHFRYWAFTNSSLEILIKFQLWKQLFRFTHKKYSPVLL